VRDAGGLVDERGLLPGELVTGEAVLLDLRPASFATRGLAFALDAVLQLLLLAGLAWALTSAAPGLDAAAVSAVGLTVAVGVLVGWPATWETLTRGRSPGKAAAGLRVVRDDGGPVRFRHALVRALVGIGELWLLVASPAVICSLANARGKRVGDLLAGTYAVRERGVARSDPPPPMPPELAGWAASTDLGRLPDDVAMAVRQFLGRAAQLHPGARERLGGSLAATVQRQVAPPPPPGTHPERFLAAVMAERRERDLVRLRSARARRDAREHALHALPFGLDRR
jgi:uncharacterized RDD family membrane protein YckC